MWPEIETAAKENRHELVLTGTTINRRLEKEGLDNSMFNLSLNYLSISETKLQHVPDDIAKLINLQTLVLHCNKLEACNENITKLTKLKTLDLSRNSISDVPANFEHLCQIVTVNLSNNCLTTFPELKATSRLAALDLSNNKLTKFPNILNAQLKCLAELKLNGNQIEEIPAEINLLPSLKLFDISSNKIKTVPGELADCHKLKEINLKDNPIGDKRLFKLIAQCRTKQIIDYVKQHCAMTTTIVKKVQNEEEASESDDDNVQYKHKIVVQAFEDNVVNIVKNSSVESVRPHILACLVLNLKFTNELFKKFIQLQNKLHDSACDKRNLATIATHDAQKLTGNLLYTVKVPAELMIHPLNRKSPMSGADLFEKLQTEANNLRKEKKRNVYTGIHKYLYLIEGKPVYPCLLNSEGVVVSFPPITNSENTKITVDTTSVLVEVTSSISQHVCRTVLDTVLKEMVNLLEQDLVVKQVRVFDEKKHSKCVYPSTTDLNFKDDEVVTIKVVRE